MLRRIYQLCISTNFSIFNRLEAFSYILPIWFLHYILLCKVRPRWVWDSTSLKTLVSRNRGGWSCILRLRENTTLRELTGFIATNHLSAHPEIVTLCIQVFLTLPSIPNWLSKSGILSPKMKLPILHSKNWLSHRSQTTDLHREVFPLVVISES